MNFIDLPVLYTTLKERYEYKTKFHLIRYTLLDMLIGWYLWYNIINVVEINSAFWSYVDLLATYLIMLMEWLVNNPGGLKLNERVNFTLAGFFNYHIFLWATFSNFLRFETFAQCMMLTMLGGVSILSAALCDFAKVLCIHFFCFDAYAIKLWRVTSYTIRELWGLVRGKKRNPLRNRRDNICLDTRQQFLSTSLFVILLFLLPTIVVYALVFRMIRLCASFIIFVLHSAARLPILMTDLEIRTTERIWKTKDE